MTIVPGASAASSLLNRLREDRYEIRDCVDARCALFARRFVVLGEPGRLRSLAAVGDAGFHNHHREDPGRRQRRWRVSARSCIRRRSTGTLALVVASRQITLPAPIEPAARDHLHHHEPRPSGGSISRTAPSNTGGRPLHLGCWAPVERGTAIVSTMRSVDARTENASPAALDVCPV